MQEEILYAKWLMHAEKLKMVVLDKNNYSSLRTVREPPRFFIRREDYERAESRMSRRKTVELIRASEERTTDRRRPTSRIETVTPDAVREVRDVLQGINIPTYQAKEPFDQVWMRDENKIYVQFDNPLFVDIEVDWSKEFPDPVPHKYPILCISAVDKHYREWFFNDSDERKLLKEFFRLRRAYQLVYGQNITTFDVPYIRGRAEILKSEAPIGQFFDLIPFLRKVRGKQISNKLDLIGKEFLGIGKVPAFTNGVDMLADIKAGAAKTKRYCTWDSHLCRWLEEKLKLLPTYGEIARISGVRLERIMYNRNIVEAVLINKLSKLDPPLVLPTPIEKAGEKYEGAIVLEPPENIVQKWVLSLDYASLYNRVMQSFNVGPDTIAKHGDLIKTERLSFLKKPDSFLSKVLRELEEVRNRHKAEKMLAVGNEQLYALLNGRDMAVKQILLSVYGYLGYKGSALYDQELAETVSVTAKAMTVKAIAILRKLGYHVVYGDTDSVFIQAKHHTLEECVEELEKLAEKVNVILRKWVEEKYNVPDERYRLELNPQHIFKRIQWSAMKNYIGLSIWQEGKEGNQLVVKGLPMIKYNTPEFLKRIMRTAYNYKLGLTSETEFTEFMMDVRAEFMKGMHDNALVIRTELHQDPMKAVSNQCYYDVARQMIAKGVHIAKNDTVEYVLVGKGKYAPVIDGVVPTVSREGRVDFWKHKVEDFLSGMLPKKESPKFMGRETLDKWG
jgi:DNA polymerase I